MYLTKISGRNLKGGDFSFSLTRANVIIGDNFKGKTRIADAVRLLLIGYLPELGKTAKATFGLSCGSTMTVHGEFDNGLLVMRSWTLKGDSVKMTEDIPDSLAKCGLLTVMLNSEEYFQLSPAERVKYVFANCPLPELAIKWPKMPGDIASEIDKEKSPQDQLDDALTRCTDYWKTAKDTAKRMEETVRGLTSLRTGEGSTARGLAMIEADQARVTQEITNLNEKKLLYVGAYKAMIDARARRQAIDRELQSCSKEQTESVTINNKIDQAETELMETETPAKSVMDLSQECFAIQNKISNHLDMANTCGRQWTALERQLSELDGKTECPFCGASGDGWKALKAAELATEIDGLKAQQTTAVKAKLAAQEAFDVASKARDDAKAVFARCDALKVTIAHCKAELARISPRLERCAALRDERDRLAPEDEVLATQMELTQTELNVKSQETVRLNNEARTAIGRARDLEHLAKAETERDQAKADQELAATAGKELKIIQAELVEAAFKPLLETANAIFGAVLLSPLAYRDGEIGTVRDGLFIGHRTMSGTEKLLSYAAIQAALAAKSPVRIMLLDEMGRLTKKNAVNTADCCQMALINKLVDQVILIDPERGEIYSSDFNLITV